MSLLLKEIGEECGPYHLDIPLKYVNAPCEATKKSKWAMEWRQKVRDYHKRIKDCKAIARLLVPGEHFFAYGELYRMVDRSVRHKDNVIADRVHACGRYRIKPWQISMTA